MTKTFTYTFQYYGEEIILTKKVTDRMEERNSHKRAYAANYFNQVLREKYGRHRAEAFGYNIKEV